MSTPLETDLERQLRDTRAALAEVTRRALRAERERDEAMTVIRDTVKLRSYQTSLTGYSEAIMKAVKLRQELADLRERAVKLRKVANSVFTGAAYGRRKNPGDELSDLSIRTSPWKCMDGESRDCGCEPNDEAPELVKHQGRCVLAEFEDLR